MSYITENIQKWLAREVMSADDPYLFWWKLKQIADEFEDDIDKGGIQALEKYLKEEPCNT